MRDTARHGWGRADRLDSPGRVLIEAAGEIMKVDWQASDGAQTYELHAAPEGRVDDTVVMRSSKPAALLTDLKQDTSYEIRVRAIGGSGSTRDPSAYTEPLRTETDDDFPFFRPGAFALDKAEPRSVDLSWTELTDVSYEVQRSEGGDFDNPRSDITDDPLFTSERLDADTRYRYRVRIVDPGDNEPMSDFSPRSTSARHRPRTTLHCAPRRSTSPASLVTGRAGRTAGAPSSRPSLGRLRT